MAILQDTLINGNVRTRDTTYIIDTTPPTNFNSMGGTKIIADNIGTITTHGNPCFSTLFLGTVCTLPLALNTEVTESNLYYLNGIQININSVGGGLIPLNYNYQTKQRNYSYGMSLGTHAAPWTQLYLGTAKSISDGTYYYFSELSGTSSGIQIFLSTQSATSASVYPNINSTSSTTGYNLGNSTHKWRYLYAYSGTIQTSDRAAKDSIHYLEEQPVVAKMSAKSTTTSTTGITMDDVIDFVKNIQPTTFCYYDGEETATEENSDPEMIQLGLIADDIKTHPVFKYVGVQSTAKELDDDGNEIEGSEHEVLGLQPLPLAVASLTACKDLIGRVEELESKMELLESRLAALENA